MARDTTPQHVIYHTTARDHFLRMRTTKDIRRELVMDGESSTEGHTNELESVEKPPVQGMSKPLFCYVVSSSAN